MDNAGFGKRLIAYLIDIIPIVLASFLVAYFFLGFDEIIRVYQENKSDANARHDFYLFRNRVRDISFIIWVIYCTFMEPSPMQGTLGKHLIGIKVVDQNGERLTFTRAIVRSLVKILSFLPCGLGIFWIFFNKNKLTWHDMAARTDVVNK
ncbi:RDD family protein [Candidatus Sumerlaeota bacterium]|nr:RDD family protein [Candidatus Sumerlaeota bacterium]